MIKVYSSTGVLLNVIFSLEDTQGERVDITEPSEFLQCGLIQAPAGKVFKPHYHLGREAKMHIQEAFILIKGKASVEVFDLDNHSVGIYPLKEGGLSVLLQGGHSLRIEEDSILYEIKNVPYEGQKKDKVWIITEDNEGIDITTKG